MLIARDFAATVRFYRDALRLEGGGDAPYAEFSIEGSSKLVVLDTPLWVSVEGHAPAPVPGTAPNGVVFAFKVADLDAEYARWCREGIAVGSPPTDRPQMGFRNLLLRDPDGDPVELFSDLRRPPPKSAVH
jgi:predicted enzyme related to lactoylglutathione lyase